MATVSFLSSGKRVKFSTGPKKRVKLNAFAKFVKKNGAKAFRESHDANAAMKKLAKDYKKA